MSPDRPSDALHAVLDDAAAGAALIECAAALAHALQRSLVLVYVENLIALHAAALPQAQALAHARTGHRGPPGGPALPAAAGGVSRGAGSQGP